MRLTRRFIVKDITQLPLSTPIRYERYYIHDRLRIQKKGNIKEKEILNEENVIIKKETITDEEFQTLQASAYAKIIRDSYLLLTDKNISIKQYLDKYEGLNRVEVSFQTEKETVP